MDGNKIQRLNTISQMVLSDAEINKLNALKAMCQEDAPSKFKNEQKYIEEFTEEEYLTRLLVARNWTVKKAFDMWEGAVNFFLEVRPESITDEEISIPASTGKMYFHGYDKEKRPVLILCARRFSGKDLDEDQEFKFAMYILEKGKELSKNSVDGKIVVLWDRTGFSKKNFSRKYVGMMKKAVKVMSDVYPELLYRFYVIRPNFLFKTFLLLCKPFMSQRTKSKFKLITDLKQLKEFFSDDNLLIELGGTSPYIYSFKGVQVKDKYTHNGNIIEPDNEDEMNEMSNEIIKEEGLEEDLKQAMLDSPTKV